MGRAELLRRHALDCELRAKALADRAEGEQLVDEAAALHFWDAADAWQITARVLGVLAEVEAECETAGGH